MTRRLLLALLAVVALVGGCGLSEDSEPKAIAPEDLPPDLLDPEPDTSTTISELPGTSVVVYLLEEVDDDVRLTEVRRNVVDPGDPGDRLVALFAPPSEGEAAQGLVTAIPADTMLRAMPVLDEETKELVLDLSSEFLSIEGPELPKAFAQIVYTVTEPELGISQVRFLVDGEEIGALDASGAEQQGAVKRTMYAALRPLPR